MSYKKKISYTIINYLIGSSDYGIFENDSLMEETKAILLELLNIIEYGIITSSSQPGSEYQRAYICGYIPKEICGCVTNIKDKDIIISLCSISTSSDIISSITVFNQGDKYKKLSLTAPSSDISALQDQINSTSNLRDFKVNFRYFVIVDLQWGRQDHIFKVLLNSITHYGVKKKLSRDDVWSDDK